MWESDVSCSWNGFSWTLTYRRSPFIIQFYHRELSVLLCADRLCPSPLSPPATAGPPYSIIEYTTIEGNTITLLQMGDILYIIFIIYLFF